MSGAGPGDPRDLIRPVSARPAPPWHPLEAVPIAVAAFALTAVVAVVIAATTPLGDPLLTLVLALFQQGLLAMVTLAWVTLRYRGWLPPLGLRSRRPVGDVVLGAFAGAGLFGLVAFVIFPIIVFLWRAVTGRTPAPPEQLPALPEPGHVVVAAILVVVVTPVAEEVFFRGFLYSSLRGRFGVTASIALSAAPFALLHPPVHLMLAIFVVGAGFALLYERRGSLLAPIAAHGLFNLIGFAFLLQQ